MMRFAEHFVRRIVGFSLFWRLKGFAMFHIVIAVSNFSNCITCLVCLNCSHSMSMNTIDMTASGSSNWVRMFFIVPPMKMLLSPDRNSIVFSGSSMKQPWVKFFLTKWELWSSSLLSEEPNIRANSSDFHWEVPSLSRQSLDSPCLRLQQLFRRLDLQLSWANPWRVHQPRVHSSH